MRVLLDTTFAQRAPYSGTAVYLGRLGRALDALDGVDLIEVCNRRRRAPAGGGPGSVRNALADQWWMEVQLPRLARRADADVIHHPLPARSHRCAVAQVVTVHDLAFEHAADQFDPVFRRYASLTHRAAARRAEAVVCVSHATAEDVRTRWGVGAQRLVVAWHGPGQALDCVPGRPDEREREHFLYVGDDEPRKNLVTLLEAYRRYREATPDLDPLPLVLAGSPGSQTAVAAGVRIERRPSPQRLARLYAGAVALVHPALYEGFGMTPLEAMRMGTPVIAGAAPAVAEVCGDAARYVDPRSPQSLAAAMTALAADGGLRDELVARGIRRAAEFSWATSARRHREAYSLASRP